MKAVKIRTHFREADSSTTNKQFKVVLIKEGLGNLGDCFYYTRESLEDAVQTKLFEGKKCYADHPTSIEEKIQPERSTRDIIGYFESVSFEEDASGRGMITGVLCISESASNEWALSLLTNSLEYAKKYKESDFVGLSINANGEASAVPIDSFMGSITAPDSVMAKLNLAKQEGITEIRPVSRLTTATSVDLVTEAGAGGQILKMIEGDRKRMKKFKEDESKMKHAAPPAKGDEAPPAKSGDHDDEDQDKALFSKMIKQYLGDDHPVDEDSMQMAKHAFEAHKEQGMEHEAAYEAAGKHLKMALDIGKKMSAGKPMKQEEDDADKDGASAASAPQKKENKEDEAHENEAESESKEKKHKESSSVMHLTAKIAKLEESLKKYELRDYLDQKMSESKKPNSVTRKFREALGQAKSKAHIDDSWKFFIKAYEAGSEEVESDSFILTEKQSFKQKDDESKIGSLADCMEN